MKVVINRCYGGFGLSQEAVKRGRELGAKWALEIPFAGEKYDDGSECDRFYGYLSSDNDRHDPLLVQVVKELGEKSWGDCAKLQVVDIPDDVEYTIQDYDGFESIHEAHRCWY